MTRREKINELKREVKYLTGQPEHIGKLWYTAASPLFAYVRVHHNYSAGCLTQIRERQIHKFAYGPDERVDKPLTEAIKQDERIPDDCDLISPEHLPLFAAWQLAVWDRFYGHKQVRVPTDEDINAFKIKE